MEQLQAYVTFIKDIITGCAAAIAAYIAIKGYNTWKEQLRGRSEHELARRVLVAVYRVRDALQPILFIAEIEDEGAMALTPLDYSDLKKSLEDKFEKLHEMETQLSVELLEAEAMWGDELAYKSRIQQLKGLGEQLDSVVYGFRRIPPEHLKEKLKNRNFDYSFDYRKFSTNLETNVRQIEDVLRPKLRLIKSRTSN